MKLFAVEISRDNSKNEVYIDDVLVLRETNIVEFKTKTYYTINSYQSNSKNLYNELIPVNGQKSKFFKYKNNPDTNGFRNKDDDLLSHSIAQDVISSLTTLNISLDRTNELLVIPIERSFTEYQIDTAQKKYRCDIFFELAAPSDKSNRIYNEIYYKWNGILAVEIFVTHKVEDFKKYDLEQKEIPIIEVEIKKKFRITENATRSEIYAYKSMLTNIFKKKIIGKLISNPSNKEYQKMVDYKEAITKFENKLNSLQDKEYEKQELISSLNKNIANLKLQENELENQIGAMKDKKLKLDAYSDMKKKIADLEANIKLKEEEIEKHTEKKSFFDRFKKRKSE